MSKKKFTVYGNCQAAALAHQLLAHQAFANEYDYVPIAPCFLITEQEILDWVARHEGALDLVIAQNLAPGWRDGNAAWDVQTTARGLRAGGKLLRYTDIYYRGVNPIPVYPKTFSRPPHCDYTDLVSLTLASLGFVDPALCAELYDAPGLLQAHEIVAIRDLAEFELSRREAGLEIRAAAAIANLADKGPAFHTFNHPGNGALAVVAQRVLDTLKIAREPVQWPAHELLQTVRFPVPASLASTYAQPVAAGLVRLEDGHDIDLRRYFEISLDYLQIFSARDLREEVRRQREDTVSGIVIGAIERALGDKLALSNATLAQVGELNSQNIGPDFLLTKADPQAVGFMVDVLDVLRRTLVPRHLGERLDLLDLGAKSGAGSQLIGFLGQATSFSKVKFNVTCADIDPTFQRYCVAKHPNVEYLNADVFEVGRQWDVVICSHVIEHVPDPAEFVRRLRTIARRYVILAFPFLEDPANLIPGHLHSLGHDFLRELKPASHQIYDGLFWTQSLCAIAVLDVRA